MNTNCALTDQELLEILFLSPNATAIYTSEQLIIQSANEAMIRLWGKDHTVIGRPLQEALPEMEGQPFIAILQEVWKTGKTYQAIDTSAELMINGVRETLYFDFCYQGLKNKSGEVYCILHTATEVTERNLNRKNLEKARLQETDLLRERWLNEELASTNEELATTNEELASTNEELQQTQETLYLLNHELEMRVQERTMALAESEARARYLLSDAPVAIGVFTGKDHIIESANHKILDIWGKTKDIIGKPLHIALPELVGQSFLNILDVVFISGEPFYGNEVKALLEHNNTIEEVYSNFVYHPLKNKAGETTSIMLVAIVVTEQVKARKLIEESETRFRFLLNVMPQQVWTAKPDGSLDYVNQIVCDDFGRNEKEIVGVGWHEFIHPEDLAGCVKTWDNALKTADEYVYEFRLLFHDQVYRWHLSRAVPLIENGKIKLWLGTNTNIDLQKSNEQKKDEFLSIASHELKTPLTSIKAFNQLMQRTKQEDVLNKLVYRSSENIQRLERLINDLLDVTKINAGKINYSSETFKFSQMLEESIENVRHTSATHEILLQNKADINYTGDQFRLEQVMHNFLTNAVKYSPGAKKVIVRSWTELDSIVVSVQDFGIGIPEDKLDKLFERYYRVDNADMRFEGLGLGLFISSEILKRHHGSFWIESKEGVGSIFNFRLPLTDQPEEIPVVNHTDSFYQDSHITITYNKVRKQLEADWTGFQNLESVKQGCLTVLSMMVKNSCYKLINDNSNVLGTWADAAEWVGESYFPMLEQAGVKYIAWVFSSSIFSQLSAKKSLDIAVTNVVTHFFTDIVEAEQWMYSI